MLWLLYFQRGRERRGCSPSQGSLRSVVGNLEPPTGVPPGATASAVGQGGAFGPPQLSQELLHSSVCFKCYLGVSLLSSDPPEQGDLSPLQGPHLRFLIPVVALSGQSSKCSAGTEHPENHPHPCFNIDCLVVTGLFGARNQH